MNHLTTYALGALIGIALGYFVVGPLMDWWTERRRRRH